MRLYKAYSTCGRTKVLYVNSFTGSFRGFTFLFTNPSVLFAFPIMLFMSLFQFRS